MIKIITVRLYRIRRENFINFRIDRELFQHIKVFSVVRSQGNILVTGEKARDDGKEGAVLYIWSRQKAKQWDTYKNKQQFVMRYGLDLFFAHSLRKVKYISYESRKIGTEGIGD